MSCERVRSGSDMPRTLTVCPENARAQALAMHAAQAPTAEMAVTPPSIRKSAPTTYAESSDATYTASFAISNGSAIRLLGLLVRRTSLTASPCSCPGKRPNIAVSVGPGLREFTRIPRSTSSALRIRARWTTAALQVETVEVVGHPLRAPTDALM